MNRHLTPLAVTLALGTAFQLFVLPLLPADEWQNAPAAAAGAEVPANCVEHTPFDGGPDFEGDQRCAGLALPYHRSGVASSTSAIWAGQWLFTDDRGLPRLGMCTFNRGGHPRSDVPAVLVSQGFPNDPSGTKRAYLTWRYGATTDNNTAAALWAVFHYYAQDAAGSNRSTDPTSALVPALGVISENTGSQSLEDAAIRLDREAERLSPAFTIEVVLEGDSHGVATVTSGGSPVPDVAVVLDVAGGAFRGGSTPLAARTDGNGRVVFGLIDVEASVTVTATAPVAGASQVYLAPSVQPGMSPQTLITSGPPLSISAVARAVPPVPDSTTTTTIAATTTTPAPTTTTAAPTTTMAAATTTIAASTTTSTTTTTTTTPETSTTVEASTTLTSIDKIDEATPASGDLESSTSSTSTTTSTTTSASASSSTSSSAPSTTEPVRSAGPVPTPASEETMGPPVPEVLALPRTGSDNTPAHIATLLLVAGVGVIGAVRRSQPGLAEELLESDFWNAP